MNTSLSSSSASTCSHCGTHILPDKDKLIITPTTPNLDFTFTTAAQDTISPVKSRGIAEISSELQVEHLNHHSFETNTGALYTPDSSASGQDGSMHLGITALPEETDRSLHSTEHGIEWEDLQENSSNSALQQFETTHVTTQVRPAHRRTLSQIDESLHVAASSGKVAIASILIGSGSNINAQDRDGKTALHHCVKNGHLDMAKLLIENGADVTAIDHKGTSILLAAVDAAEEDIVKLLAAELHQRSI